MQDPIGEAIEQGKRESKTTLIDLTAPWCSACFAQEDIIEKIQPTLKDTLVVKIDIEEHPDVAESYEILSLPAILIFDRSGSLRWRSAGRVVQAGEIMEAVSFHAKSLWQRW